MNTTTNSPEILESIDCTPTWEALLLPMLDLYGQQSRAKCHKDYTREQWRGERDSLVIEFKRMAEAADNWNKYAKQNLPR